MSKGGFASQLFNDPELLGESLVFDADAPFGAVSLDIGPEHPYFLGHIPLKVESILLCQSELAEIVIEGLLGDAHYFGSFLQTDLVLMPVDGVVDLPPLLHVLKYLLDASFPVSLLLGLTFGSRRIVTFHIGVLVVDFLVF